MWESSADLKLQTQKSILILQQRIKEKENKCMHIYIT